MQGGKAKYKTRHLPYAAKQALKDKELRAGLAGITTRSTTANESAFATFFNVVEKQDHQLALFCNSNRSMLGLSAMGKHSEGEIAEHAETFLQGYHASQSTETKEEKEAAKEMGSLYIRLQALKDLEKQRFHREIIEATKGGTVSQQLLAKASKTLGLPFADGIKAVMGSLMKKVMPSGGDDKDKYRNKTEGEILDGVTSSKVITMPISIFMGFCAGTVIKTLVPFIPGSGIVYSIAGSSGPLLAMFLPPLGVLCAKGVISDALGSPFATGNINNIIRDVDPRQNHDVIVPENLPTLPSTSSKANSRGQM